MDLASNINFFAVLVAAIVYFLVGSLWYSPVLFAKKWMEASNINPSGSKEGLGKIMTISFLITFIQVLILGLFLSNLGVQNVGDGLLTAFLISVGFSAVTIGLNYLYEGKKPALFFINWGYNLVGLCLASIVLSLWQ